jgi:ribosomal protein S18 acetylase RimI-like enzyme
MKIRKLRDEDIVDAVRVLALSCERELSAVLKDIDFARDILFEFFKMNKEGCYVAEDGRVLAFTWVLIQKVNPLKFLRKRLGLIDGLRAYLLLKFFLRKPKKGECFLVFLAVSPLRRGSGIGTTLMEKVIEDLREKKMRRITCILPANSDAVVFFRKIGFDVDEIFENRLAEKYFFSRQWILMGKDLSS